MAGIVRVLSFAEGVSVSAPSQTFLSASSFVTYASDAAYISAKGTAAEIGDAYLNTTDDLVHYYDDNGIWRAIEAEKNNYVATVAPTANDDTGSEYTVGSKWVDVTNDKAYICVDASASSAVWKQIDSTGAPNLSTTSKSADYTILDTDDFITVDASSTTVTLTLPAVASNDGKQVIIHRIDSTETTSIILDGDGVETINGNETAALDGLDNSIALIATSSGWYTNNKYTPMAVVSDEKSAGTAGGTFTSGDWRTRTLNTVEFDQSILTLSSNQIILGPGSYEFHAKANAINVNQHIARIQNITDGTTVGRSNTSFSGSTGNDSIASIFCKTTITDTKVFELQHNCVSTYADYGWGFAANLGVNERFAQVIIKKIG